MVEQEAAVAWALRHDPEWQALLLSDELLQLQLRRDGRWRNPGLSVGRVMQVSGIEREQGVNLDVLSLLTWPVRMQLSGPGPGTGPYPVAYTVDAAVPAGSSGLD